MLDVSIIGRKCNRYVSSLFLSISLTCFSLSPLQAIEYSDWIQAMPKHYEHDWFLRYFDSLDEDVEIGEVVDFLISFKASMEAKGFSCPSLLDILYHTKEYVESQGIEVDSDLFEEIVDEVIKRETPYQPSSYQNLIFKDSKPTFELVKKKHHHKDKKDKEFKMKSKGIFGFLKCVGGALIFIVPIPGAQAVGSGLVLMGINDMVDSALEQGEENERLQRLDDQRRIERQLDKH